MLSGSRQPPSLCTTLPAVPEGPLHAGCPLEPLLQEAVVGDTQEPPAGTLALAHAQAPSISSDLHSDCVRSYGACDRWGN